MFHLGRSPVHARVRGGPVNNPLDEAHEWYEAQVAGLGGKLIEELWVATRRIVIFPASCEEVIAGVSKCLIRRFPHMLIY